MSKPAPEASAFADEALRAARAIAGTLAMQIRAASNGANGLAPEQGLYDLIVPVFNAPDVLRRCVDSLIANTDPRHVIHLVDDASTDPGIEPLLERYAARHAHIRRYRLAANLGFPGAVNAALASTTRDVVLINADTEYPANWLARMDRCRRSHAAIHAVSPLSNNATICSVPGFNQHNDLPPGMSLAQMDELVAGTSLRRYPPAPTVVGFCMLITRRAIEDVGMFDMTFGRGYGEEVDWCQRAWAKGYASVICDDVYVYHHGGAGFAAVGEKDVLQRRNALIVARRWPRYEAAVQSYCMTNPLRFQQQRIYESVRRSNGAALRVLHVTHNFDQLAGTELFTRLLIDGTRDRAVNTVLFPAPLQGYYDATVELEGRGLLAGGLMKVRMNSALSPAEFAVRGGALTLRSPYAERFFAEVLAASNAQVVQFNHFANLGSLALPLVARALGARVVLTLHDYFLLCPDWNLLHANGSPCGEARASPDNPRCLDCLGQRIQSRPGTSRLDVAEFLRLRAALVRAVVEDADAVIAPSQFVRNQFMRALGPEIGERIRVIPNGTVAYPFDRRYRPESGLRIAFVGNVGALKGASVFAEAARRLAGGRVRFVVLGAMAPDNDVATVPGIEIRGSYTPRELLGLLQDVDVVFIGSIANETYCYTLDEAFRAGAPVIATAVGAITERVVEGRTGVLIPPNDVDALVEAIRRLDGDRALLASMRESVARLAVRSVAETVAEYHGIHEALVHSTDGIEAVCRTLKESADPTVPPPVTLAQHLAATGLRLDLPLVAVGQTSSKRRPGR